MSRLLSLLSALLIFGLTAVVSPTGAQASEIEAGETTSTAQMTQAQPAAPSAVDVAPVTDAAAGAVTEADASEGEVILHASQYLGWPYAYPTYYPYSYYPYAYYPYSYYPYSYTWPFTAYPYYSYPYMPYYGYPYAWGW